MKSITRLVQAILFASFVSILTGQTTYNTSNTSGSADTPAETVPIRLDLDDHITTDGIARAYVIPSEAKFVPGQLGDAFLGDIAIETGRIRAVFARTDKPDMGLVRPGTLMDVTSGNKGIDYIGSLNSTVNPLTTGSLAIYTDVHPGISTSKTTATVIMAGYIGDLNEPYPAPHQLISVATTCTAVSNSPTLELATSFTNETSRTAYLRPADAIDWGTAQAFTVGSGFAATTAPAHFVLGTVDDFALGYYTSGSKLMEGLHAGRDSLALAAGNLQDVESYIAANRKSLTAEDTNLPAEFVAVGASVNPQLGMVMFPGTESRYVSSLSGMPRNEPIYVPKTSIRYVDGKATLISETSTLTRLFEKPSVSDDSVVEIEPGASYTFTRYLRVSDGNWASIAHDAYKEKNTELGTLAGAVVEHGTGELLPGAKVRISGGPHWDGKPGAPALMQVKTREDGTFAAKVPAGKYLVEAELTGRRQSGAVPALDVAVTSTPRIAVINMTRPSLIRMAISEAETATSSPLPVKVTIISKPPYATENYGFTPKVAGGIRNTMYLPQGAAVFPLTPGRYRLVISRGIEYDIMEKDISLAPGQELTVTGSLPHVMKQLLPGMVSMDAGLVTDASGEGYATAETRAIQAACEGVPIIISGDYGQATNLQQAIVEQGLERWVKAFMGRRFLLHKNNLTADVFAYPLDKESASSLDKALKKAVGVPPDVALSDLKKEFPNLIFEIERPLHPEAGYLVNFAFNDHKKLFENDDIPPPDFNAFQVFEGKKLGQEADNYSRYIAMQLERLGKKSLTKAPPLSPVGSSASRLPYGQEIGYPRMYLYLNADKPFSDVTESDIVTAVRGQHTMVTNGPILLFDALNYNTLRFDIKPGEIVDLSTTEVIRIRARVLAAPWVNLSGLTTRENGQVGIVVQAASQSSNVQRYPSQGQGIGSNVYTRYLKTDAVLDASAFSTLRTLEPVVPDALEDFGGRLYPFAITGPIFVDRDGDGKISIDKKEQ